MQIQTRISSSIVPNSQMPPIATKQVHFQVPAKKFQHQQLDQLRRQAMISNIQKNIIATSPSQASTKSYKSNNSDQLENNTQIQHQRFRFADDQFLEPKSITKKNAPLINLEIRSVAQNIRLDKQKETILPAMITLSANENELDITSRPGIDLICVLDISGSMEGEKILMVKSTVNYLMTQLTKKDRLCLIEFNNEAKRLCPLVTMCKENKPILERIVNKLEANGTTDINIGMQIAFEVLNQRRYRNSVTSIFLLSDGQDENSDLKIRQTMRSYQQMSQMPFTIHSFGFGEDHDSFLMEKIATLRDGNFYFVENVKRLDEYFIDALGGLFSVAAQNINISVNVLQNPMIKTKLRKTYGNMWKQKNESTYEIEIIQLIGGNHKDFVFELLLPRQQDNFCNREGVMVVEVQMSGSLNSGESIQMSRILTINLFNEQHRMDNRELDKEVLVNYYRVQAAESIYQALHLSELGRFNQATQVISDSIEKVRTLLTKTKVPDQSERLQSILSDLISSGNKCNQQQYHSDGRHSMVAQTKVHMEQRSCPSYRFSCSNQNQYQMSMLNDLQKTKKQI